jgi:hypothetical protein
VALAGGELVVELVEGEPEFFAGKVVADDADDLCGCEARVVEHFEQALGGEVANLEFQERDFGEAGRGFG